MQPKDTQPSGSKQTERIIIIIILQKDELDELNIDETAERV